MPPDQSFLRTSAHRSSAILIGLLLILAISFSPRFASIHVARRDTHLDAAGHEVELRSNATLIRRQTFQCSAAKPCSNGACCGGAGYCGYGPTYCGTGCVSNCNAAAECGQFAKTPGTQCPLNTCCSQYGFCGTTVDFCGKGCQSNCVLNPSPPAGRSPTGMLQNKVIGYYESWSARSNCHKVVPTDLPLDALTHVNFAFAYIEPGSYQVVTMDTSTPATLFQDTANIKSIKQDISVFVSVGGWTFSDNNTATQSLYGEIAADASKRQTFANNVVHFMRQYGFDGLDIDWEYPGAPDRGGSAQDTANYVALVRTLRQTFDASGNKFGLSFTAPSSYWYLRWFDLPNMIKYADWINLMTYDLHGVWDATNPIGSIVQAHTNLTEIKLAAQLFWRVNIPPAKIVMGFGFYGRSFTLADPACTKPGCAFSGASNPGPCSAAGGILAYYEIMNVLKGTTPQITPTHDTQDAVNYFTFDKDQWVSYDDAVTFKQKVDWANGLGLGGALIWASDLDDDQYSAHAGLLARSIQSTPSLQNVDKALSNPQAVIQDIAGSNGQDCFAYQGDCVNLNDNNAMAAACGAGNTPHCGKPICCPTKTAPKNCIWRGDNNGNGVGSDCSAQCLPGESNIQSIGSNYGGGFLNDGNTNKCGRGWKVFCCPSPDFGQVTDGCSYASCRSDCPTGTVSVFKASRGCFVGFQQYCCPDPPQLTACHWNGGGGGQECANAVCGSTELEVDRDQFGDSMIGGCSWGRMKAVCCTVQKAPPKPAFCTADLCKLLPGYCPNDDDDESANPLTKRALALLDPRDSGSGRALEKRGSDTPYYVNLGNNVGFTIIAIAYPAIAELFGVPSASLVLRRFFRLIAGYCVGPSIQEGTVPPGGRPSGLTGLQTEHPIDRQIMRPFAQASTSGILPSGQIAPVPPIPRSFWKDRWHVPTPALAARPPVGGPQGVQPDTANDRVMEGFGSYDWPYPFLAVDARINGAKGRIMALRVPTAIPVITRLARDAVREDSQPAADALLQAIRVGFATFEYLNTPHAMLRWNAVRQQIRQQFGYIQQDLAVPNLVTWWDLFTDDYFQVVGVQAQRWAEDAIRAAADPFEQARLANRHLQIYGQVVGALHLMLEQVTSMTLPGDNSMPNPQPPGGGGLP
ncbi:MAG: hypothetical protein M1826_007679 [Phylliscum demangeonii]|nr:MAG: hypothetical protein M1826_007679 [Phylliscum demangeonii]